MNFSRCEPYFRFNRSACISRFDRLLRHPTLLHCLLHVARLMIRYFNGHNRFNILDFSVLISSHRLALGPVCESDRTGRSMLRSLRI